MVSFSQSNRAPAWREATSLLAFLPGGLRDGREFAALAPAAVGTDKQVAPDCGSRLERQGVIGLDARGGSGSDGC